MKDYYYFKAEDFVEDADFRRWVYHALPEDETFWQQWLRQHPYQQEQVAAARRVLLDIRGEQLLLSSETVDAKVAQLVAYALQNASAAPAAQPAVRRLSAFWWVAAASVLLILSAGIWLMTDNSATSVSGRFASRKEPDTATYQEVTNTEKSPKVLRLADGSRVTLYQNSRLRYPDSFAGQHRTVTLTGEAFFQIARDTSHPFLVYSNEVVTKVLGTSFHVRAYEEDTQVVVSVRSGRVAVFRNPDAPVNDAQTGIDTTELILKPNQRATFLKAESRLTRSLVEQPVAIEPAVLPSDFTFKHTPVAQVFRTLEKAYQVTIIFDEKRMASCTLTAKLGNASLYQKLDWICAGTNASYRVVDGQIIVIGQGCQ